MMGNATRRAPARPAPLSWWVPATAARTLHFDPAVVFDPAPGIDYSGLSPELLKDIVSSDRRIPFPAPMTSGKQQLDGAGSADASGKPFARQRSSSGYRRSFAAIHRASGRARMERHRRGRTRPAGRRRGSQRAYRLGIHHFWPRPAGSLPRDLNPADARHYQTKQGGWQFTWKCARSLSRCVCAAPVEVHAAIYAARSGAVAGRTARVALRWVGAEPGTAGYLGSLRWIAPTIGRNSNKPCRAGKCPPENIVYADRDGNIGEHSTGLAPVRKGLTGLLAACREKVESNGAVSFRTPSCHIASIRRRLSLPPPITK